MTPEPARPPPIPKRILLLFPAESYRVDAYVAAAARLGVELVLGTDLPDLFVRQGLPVLAVDFRNPEASADAIEKATSAKAGGAAHAMNPGSRSMRLDGIVATHESSAVVAALAAARLGLPHAQASAAYAARNKRRMREIFAETGVPSPRALALGPNDDPASLLPDVVFPCVVKPTMLSGSQGVIRADDPAALFAAVRRVRGILARHSSAASSDPDFYHVLVEDYLPGREVAVEAIVTRGHLETLAIFDKPDELAGPYFEETLYVTPSRLPAPVQSAVLTVVGQAASALGLSHGPVHAELRVDGLRVAVVEIAGRSIGGLCSRTIEPLLGPLEDIILAHAAGLPLPDFHPGASAEHRPVAAGVMMMPIPRSGVLRTVKGLDAARAVPLVENVTVALSAGESIRALPEGSSYLGFIFARGRSPQAVESALRASFAELTFELSPLLDQWPSG